jgi:hypothetical protein
VSHLVIGADGGVGGTSGAMWLSGCLAVMMILSLRRTYSSE